MRRLAAYLPAALWAGFVLWIGGIPNLHAPPSTLPLDKVAHVAIYGVLGALIAWGWLRAGPRAALPVALACALLVGAADELHQRRVPGRAADPLDWAADALGILVASAVIIGVRRGR